VQRAVFLDRDNTLIANSGDLGDPDGVCLIPGVAPGLRRLREAGYQLVVVTNQGGVGRGKYTEQDVDAVHLRIAELIDHEADTPHLITRFYYCPYHPDAIVPEYRRDHPWRKPHPGMLIQASRDLDLDLTRSWLIGDQIRDIQAGRTAGCSTILIGRKDHALANDKHAIDEADPNACVDTFDDAVELIVRERSFTRKSRQGRALTGNDGLQSDSLDVSAAVIAELANIRRATLDLAEELRTEQIRKSEFTPTRLAAGVAQLMVLFLALLGLMQASETDVFLKWMAGAGLMQLLTIAILLADQRG
jgi:D,D-heptose 1,7-bisphosphate phosphatase